jgi:hypothetical protein
VAEPYPTRAATAHRDLKGDVRLQTAIYGQPLLPSSPHNATSHARSAFGNRRLRPLESLGPELVATTFGQVKLPVESRSVHSAPSQEPSFVLMLRPTTIRVLPLTARISRNTSQTFSTRAVAPLTEPGLREHTRQAATNSRSTLIGFTGTRKGNTFASPKLDSLHSGKRFQHQAKLATLQAKANRKTHDQARV